MKSWWEKYKVNKKVRQQRVQEWKRQAERAKMRAQRRD